MSTVSAKFVLEAIKSSDDGAFIPGKMLKELIPFIRIPDKDGEIFTSVEEILASADRLYDPPPFYQSMSGDAWFYQLPEEKIICIYRVGLANGSKGDFKQRLEEGDDRYAEIWHAAHKIADEEMPHIKSGLCQQPGLAATLANFAVSEINKIIDKSNEIE